MYIPKLRCRVLAPDVVFEIPHPFPLNTHFGTLAVGLGSFPFDYPTYLVQSDSCESSLRHSEFDILR